MGLVLLHRRETKEDFHLQVSLRRSSPLFGCEAVSNQNTQQALALPEKEVIQPHLPVRLPCYDFTPVTSPAFGTPLLAVKVTTSGMASSHSVTGCVYKARERIHSRMADRRLLAIPASCTPLFQEDSRHVKPCFRLSVLVSAQQSAFAVGVLFDLYAFHRSTGNSLCPYRTPAWVKPWDLTSDLKSHLQTLYAQSFRITLASSVLPRLLAQNTVIASSSGKEVHDPWAFYLHAALLSQAFTHCGKFPTAASRRSLGRVSVPVWLIILSDQLLIIALPFPAIVPLPRAGSYALLTRPPLETPLPVRLACVKHAASVHPEPGSNSP
ncbi:hypothetical protein Ddye_001847 [Dipteronia dyeriana]|uniref:Uncharacterized protein n=1 Tax=Dipteronia dyeriana TaxID=168575 RepID=A0AAD9XPZ4_9ROSI|nr:hypothetical protein Ddye_001847 [Dipteronia dyeriana]